MPRPPITGKPRISARSFQMNALGGRAGPDAPAPPYSHERYPLRGSTQRSPFIACETSGIVVAAPAAVKHQRHQSATNHDREDNSEPKGDPPVNAHGRCRTRPGVDREA